VTGPAGTIMNNLLHYLKEGLRGLCVHRLMSAAAVTVIAACLLITGSFGLVSYNLDLAISSLQSQDIIMAFVDESYSREEAIQVAYVIQEKVPNLQSITFVSKEELFEQYLSELGEDAYLMEDLREDNPLRDSFRLVMRDSERHEETLAALEQVPGVAGINSEKELSDRLTQLEHVVEMISLALVGLLGVVSVFVTYNTVRIAMFARREEIAIMKLVGATNGFVRGPFLFEGMLIGLFAGTLGFFLQWGAYHLVGTSLLASSGIFDLVPFAALAMPTLGTFLAGGLIIGVGGSLVSISRFLKV